MAAKRFSVDAVFRGIDRISKPVRSMSRSVSNFVRNSNKKIGRLGQNFKKLGSVMAKAIKGGVALAIAGLAGLGAAIFSVVKQFTKIEDAEAAFTPLLGGAGKAKKLVDELNKTAATTPFQFENLAGAANQLLPVMNGDIQKTIKTLRMLGDTSGGNAQKLESITRGFTKAMLKGKVDMESLNMIAEAGVPIFGDLAKVMGTKVGAQFFKDISAGKVTTDQLTKAFENMTGKGGIFFKGMEIASKTTTGVISTMKDNISLAAASIGKILAPTVKIYAGKVTELAKKIKSWVEQNEELIKTKLEQFIKGVIFISTKMIAIFKEVVSVVKAITPMIKAAFDIIVFLSPFLKPFIGTLLVFKGVMIAIALVTKLWTAAQILLNIALTANPIGLIIVGIAALIAGIVVLVQNWDLVTAAVKRVWNWFSELLDNPLIAAAALVFSPFITIPALIYKHWEPIKEFFQSIWQGLIAGFENAMSIITGMIKKIEAIPGVKSIFEFLGIAGGEGEGETTTARPVTPQERLSRTIEQTENNSTLTIRDQTGRAELSPQRPGGPKIALSMSGGL